MKYISKEEMEKEAWNNKGGSSDVYCEMASMEVGKILFIEQKDWDKKYPPTAIARYLQKKYNRGFIMRRHAARKGWAAERIK